MKNYISKYSNLIKGLITFIVFFSSSYIQLTFLNILNINPKSLSIKEATILSCISSFIITIIVVLLYRKDLKKEFKIFKDKLSDNLDIGFKYWMIGLFIMMVSNLILANVLNAGEAANEQTVQKMISAAPLLLLISAGILAPILEEITFRKVFRDNIKNNIIYVIVSGFIFGYLHVSGTNDILQLLYIIPYSSLGVCFAISYVKTKTVFTSMTMHMLHNTILTLFSILI